MCSAHATWKLKRSVERVPMKILKPRHIYFEVLDHWGIGTVMRKKKGSRHYHVIAHFREPTSRATTDTETKKFNFLRLDPPPVPLIEVFLKTFRVYLQTQGG